MQDMQWIRQTPLGYADTGSAERICNHDMRLRGPQEAQKQRLPRGKI